MVYDTRHSHLEVNLGRGAVLAGVIRDQVVVCERENLAHDLAPKFSSSP